jgi:hypothetical protein
MFSVSKTVAWGFRRQGVFVVTIQMMWKGKTSEWWGWVWGCVTIALRVQNCRCGRGGERWCEYETAAFEDKTELNQKLNQRETDTRDWRACGPWAWSRLCRIEGEEEQSRRQRDTRD